MHTSTRGWHGVCGTCADIFLLLTRVPRYPTTIEEDTLIIESSTVVRQKVAARLVRIEKQILQAARAVLVQHADTFGLELVKTRVPPTAAVKLS